MRIGRLFGSDWAWPLYDPTRGFETYYANWYIGKGRARALANYALSRFDELLAPHLNTLTDAQRAKADQARALLESTVLSWEDESLGPKTPEGIPFAKTGKGAKQRYIDYIDKWVGDMVNALVTGELPAGTEAQASPATPVQPVEQGQTTPPAVVQQFSTRADEILNQPWLIPALRRTFKEQARKLIPTHGIEYALDFLQQQVDSMGYAGTKHGGLSSALIKHLFGAGDTCMGG